MWLRLKINMYLIFNFYYPKPTYLETNVLSLNRWENQDIETLRVFFQCGFQCGFPDFMFSYMICHFLFAWRFYHWFFLVHPSKDAHPVYRCSIWLHEVYRRPALWWMTAWRLGASRACTITNDTGGVTAVFEQFSDSDVSFSSRFSVATRNG